MKKLIIWIKVFEAAVVLATRCVLLWDAVQGVLHSLT